MPMREMMRGASLSADPREEAHRVFHSMWTKARESPAYDKREWLRFEELLRQLGLAI